MTSFEGFLKEQLEDPEFKAEYDALEPEFTIIQAIIDARRNSGVTQKQLSERTGIAQGDINKIENGEANPSLKTLKQLASGMDMKLKLEFLPITMESGQFYNESKQSFLHEAISTLNAGKGVVHELVEVNDG